MSTTDSLLTGVLIALGAVLVLEAFGMAKPRVRGFLGACCIAVAVAVAAFGGSGGGSATTDRVSADTFPGGGSGLVDRLSLRASDGRVFTLAHSGYGAVVSSNASRVQFYIGKDGQPGELQVTPRMPSGESSGSSLAARDGSDRYSLALDHRLTKRPRLLSESPSPLTIETHRGADLRLAPGNAGRRARPARVVVVGNRQLTLDPRKGVLALPQLKRFPTKVARGSIALVNGRLFLNLGRWVPIRTQ